MKRNFVVVDGDNQVSWSATKDRGEAFASFKAAVNRAKDLADCEPGTEILVCKVAARVKCTVTGPLVRKE